MTRKVLPILGLLILLVGCTTNAVDSGITKAVSLTCENAPVTITAYGQDVLFVYGTADFDGVTRRIKMTRSDIGIYMTDGHWTVKGSSANLGPPPPDWMPESVTHANIRINGSACTGMWLSGPVPETHNVAVTEMPGLIGKVFEHDGLQVMVVGLSDNEATVLIGADNHVVWCTISVEDLLTMQQTWTQGQWRFVHVPPGKWYIEGLTPIEMMPSVIVYRKIS